MVDSNPAAKSFRFPCFYKGYSVLGTAVARNDEIELFPVPDVCIEIQLEVFEAVTTKLIVAAHTRRPS